MTPAQIRKLVRDEVRAELRRMNLVPTRKRYRSPCGRGDSPPECDGSAARGPDFCTCPGVKIEYY